jgi:hypothetical protein
MTNQAKKVCLIPSAQDALAGDPMVRQMKIERKLQ